MRAWLITALILLLAVPHQTLWLDYEIARRGLLAVCCGLLCLYPGSLPRRVPGSVWAINLLALWMLLRSFGVANQGYALETASHYLALATLLLLGTASSLRLVLTAALPTGLVVAGVTLAQSFGYLLPLPGVQVPTSTLGNLNTASEVLTICGAAAACLFATDGGAIPASSKRPDHNGPPAWLRPLAWITLLLCAAAIWINGSRSGLLALPLGCLLALLGSRRRLLLGALLAGLGLGFAITATPSAAPAELSATATAPAPSTVDVRLALWQGGMLMVKERPLFGHGAGQFQIHYPRFRTAEELELSTFHRKFLAAPATAHNDYLQLLIEGGIPALLLLVIAGWLLLRRTPPRYWAPLLAFATVALVRAPIGNAPAAALVFLIAGAMLGQFRRADEATISLAPGRQIIKGVLFGGLMLWFGSAQLLSQIAGAGMLERRAAERDPEGQLECVKTALLFRPYDHNFRQLLAQAALLNHELPAARQSIEAMRRQRPDDSRVQWLWVELLRAEGKRREAFDELQVMRKRDPYDTTTTIWTVEILVELRQSPSAIVILYNNPQLRPNLAELINGLAEFADRRSDRTDATLLRLEHSFISTLDHMIARRRVAAQTHLTRFLKQLAQVDTNPRDPRALILAAAQALALGDRTTAESLAVAMRNRRPLAKTHLQLMDPVIDPLRDLPAWRELLGEQPR